MSDSKKDNASPILSKSPEAQAKPDSKTENPPMKDDKPGVNPIALPAAFTNSIQKMKPLSLPLGPDSQGTNQ